MKQELLVQNEALSIQQRADEQCCQLAQRYGLSLTQAQLKTLQEARKEALEDTGRLEFGPGVLPDLVYAFCDSPFLERDGFAGFLREAQALFYALKNETADALSDAELISVMEKLFNGEAQGSLEYLAETSPERLVRIALGKEKE